ncbi:MAG: hypothetical protein WA801_03330 [Pseudolabrys sp.]|jgi:hypothetical protein
MLNRLKSLFTESKSSRAARLIAVESGGRRATMPRLRVKAMRATPSFIAW